MELTSIVRDTVSKIITIENPLENAVEIKKEMLISDNENISFNPQSFSIPAHSVFIIWIKKKNYHILFFKKQKYN